MEQGGNGAKHGIALKPAQMRSGGVDVYISDWWDAKGQYFECRAQGARCYLRLLLPATPPCLVRRQGTTVPDHSRLYYHGGSEADKWW